jgi:predicted Zn-dependent protease
MLMLSLAGVARGQSLEELYGAGTAALKASNAQRAIELLSVVEAQNPNYRDVQMLLGQSHLVASRHRQAKQHFERVLRANPQNGLAAFFLGFSLYQSARYVEALEILDRAQALAPGNPNPLIYRGLSFLKIGRPDEARAELSTALDIAPDEPTAQAAMAELELTEGDAASAEARLIKVLRNVPSVDNRILLARAILEGGRPNEAVPLLQQLDDELPNRSDVLYLLAQALLRGGDKDRGRSELERFKKQRAVEERLRVLEATVSTDPEDTDTRLELLRLLIDNEQPGRAQGHLTILEQLLRGDRRLDALRQDLARSKRSS